MKFLRAAAMPALLFLAPVCVRAAKRPLNPRKKRAAPGVAAPAADKRKLAGRWDPRVSAAIELLIETHGAGSPSYDADAPPVAVLPITEGLVDGDFAELVLWKLVRQADFKVDDNFWNIVPLAYGRQRIRAAYEEFHEKPPSAWQSLPEFHAFRKGLLKSYRDVCAKVGRKDCRVYAARLFRGYTKEDARSYAELVWDEEVAREESLDSVPGFIGDPDPVVVKRGLKTTLELVDLARLLRASGFDVWTAALTSQPVLEAAAPKLGLDVTRVVGIKQSLFKDRLTGRVVDPIPARGGLIEAIVRPTGRTPAVVVGATEDDEALMSYGNGLRILLDSGWLDAPDAHLRALAAQRRWLVQPAFTKR